jgi:SPP1 gp7 family putative phage head morphogenesis protein
MKPTVSHNNTLTLVYNGANKYDPTKTTALRNRFSKDIKDRFTRLQKVIYNKIVTNDCFGLNNPLLINVGEFDFPRSKDKITAFMDWLQKQVDNEILDIKEFTQVGHSIEDAWTNQYISDSYARGVARARYELNKAGYGVPTMEDTGGINISMSAPMHMDRVGVLFIRTYSELKGITAAMDTQISKVLAQGMADGNGPKVIARKLLSVIDGTNANTLGITDTLGRFIPASRRAEMLARTEVIRAHHLATIQEYRNWAAVGVTVTAEFKDAGDDRVCDECKDLDGQEYTLDEAESVIPVHPNCRCIMLPKKAPKPETSKQIAEVLQTIITE